MVQVVVTILLVAGFVSLVSPGYLSAPSRKSVVFSKLSFLLGSLVGPVGPLLLASLVGVMLTLLFLNLHSNLPMASSPSLYYFFTFSVSMALWGSLAGLSLSTNLVGFVSHMMPYGAPLSLGVLLPLIEIFSQLIRPVTLMIRLSTNLSAGHILLYMFSLFALASLPLSAAVFGLSFMLLALEVSISLLQAYIFVSLVQSYLSESVN